MLFETDGSGVALWSIFLGKMQKWNSCARVTAAAIANAFKGWPRSTVVVCRCEDGRVLGSQTGFNGEVRDAWHCGLACGHHCTACSRLRRLLFLPLQSLGGSARPDS